MSNLSNLLQREDMGSERENCWGSKKTKTTDYCLLFKFIFNNCRVPTEPVFLFFPVFWTFPCFPVFCQFFTVWPVFLDIFKNFNESFISYFIVCFERILHELYLIRSKVVVLEGCIWIILGQIFTVLLKVCISESLLGQDRKLLHCLKKLYVYLFH